MGKLSFFLPSDLSMTTVASTNQAFAEQHSGSYFREWKVDAMTIDLFTERNNIEPDFLKIDVEQHELEVVKGGIKTLRKCQPVIICEVFTSGNMPSELFRARNPIIYELEQILKSLNYRFFAWNENGLIEEIFTLNTSLNHRNLLFKVN